MQTWLGWGTLNIKEFLDTARMSNADRESGSASSNYTPHPWGGKDIPPHFPFWVPASLWNVLWGTVWCLKGQDTSNDLWVGGSCMIWIHLLIPPQMLKMSHGHVTQEQLSKSTKTSQNFGHPHSCRSTESGVMQGQFLSVLESPPISLSNKAIPWHVLSLSILREKKTFYTIPGSTPV